jgi:hypothetical protein
VRGAGVLGDAPAHARSGRAGDPGKVIGMAGAFLPRTKGKT